MEVHRRDLFPTPIWQVDLSHLHGHMQEMIADAEELIATDPFVGNQLFSQSRTHLQSRGGPAWKAFFHETAAIMQHIMERDYPPTFPVTGGTLRSWAMRITDPKEFDRAGGGIQSVLHAHLPSFLSSVFYLQVPDELLETGTGGTTFRDPASSLSQMHRQPWIHIPPNPFELVIFPSHLEHAPERPQGVESFSTPRIVVSTDLRLTLD